ncbi:MAG: ATP-binding protein [Minicystis sp.]
MSEEHAASAEERWIRLLAEGEQTGEGCVRSADYRMIDVEYTARAHFVPGRHLAMLHDVTDRRRTEAALAAERSWLRAVIERSPVSIVLSEDTDGRRVMANRHAEELFGRPLPRDRGIAQYIGSICDREGSPLALDDTPTARALRGESTTGKDLVIRRPDGTTVPILVSAGPIRDDRGRILGAVAIHDDLTQIREFERLREEWTSMVAHDFRQPVAVIHGYADLLARCDDPAVTTKAAHIVTSAQRLNRMIGDLLDVSRLEARRLELTREPTDLAALVRAALERASAETLGHRVEVAVRGALPPVDIDPGRVEQVLGNLLSNAAKYGEPGADIQVILEPYGGAARVSVVNRGPGISPEDLAWLFQRFQRAAAAGTKIGGVGLGLYISKGLIEAHGGRMWAESNPGDRTSFHFTLPAVDERVAEAAGEPASGTHRVSTDASPSRASRSGWAPLRAVAGAPDRFGGRRCSPPAPPAKLLRPPSARCRRRRLRAGLDARRATIQVG